MPDRSRKKTEADVNQLAAAILAAVTGEGDQPSKNPAAVMLGRMGGLKGGKARAAKLSAKKRTAIASNAAKARWSKRPSK
jgi:hypothetical protein